jgi:hypothetical protein
MKGKFSKIEPLTFIPISLPMQDFVSVPAASLTFVYNHVYISPCSTYTSHFQESRIFSDSLHNADDSGAFSVDHTLFQIGDNFPHPVVGI